MKKIILSILTFILIISSSVFSQNEENVSETDSAVPELFAFHDVVYPLWHTAYPNKDYALFKQLLRM